MKNLIFEIVDQIGIVKVNRPTALNALNREVVEELDELLEKIQSDMKIAVLIFGSGDHFAAGADIKGMVDLNVEEAKKLPYSDYVQQAFEAGDTYHSGYGGLRLGGGLDLAMACDLRIASKTAKMGFPELNLGIITGAGGTV